MPTCDHLAEYEWLIMVLNHVGILNSLFLFQTLENREQDFSKEKKILKLCSLANWFQLNAGILIFFLLLLRWMSDKWIIIESSLPQEPKP